MHTAQTHWVRHSEVPLFLSRPLFQISECKRLLLGAKTSLTRAASVDMMCVDIEMPKRAKMAQQQAAGKAAEVASGSQEAATPAWLLPANARTHSLTPSA